MALKEDKKLENEPENTAEDIPVEDAAAEVISPEELATLREKALKVDDYMDKFLRVSAEFDNFRKRTVKEKDSLFAEGRASCALEFLPLADNMERAVAAAEAESDEASLKQGMEMILKQLRDILKSLSVEEIPAVGETFCPEVHNAVMHVENEEAEPGTIVEEFQKGYKMGDKILRHSMVKVAN